MPASPEARFFRIGVLIRQLQGDVAALAGGGGGGGSPDASATVKGISKLSVAPAVATDPIAAGTNDPRMSDARTPLAHTHPESDITGLTADLAARFSKYAQIAKFGVD